MTDTLQQLSYNEFQIFNEAGYQQRYTGTRLVDTSSEWLLKDYKSIHQRYLNLFKKSNDELVKLEILKRLAFLNWCYVIESDYYTGIKELDETSIFNSYVILNEYIKEKKIDAELEWMLSYYSSWEYAIYEYSKNKLTDLNLFIKKWENFPDITFPKNKLDKGVMDNRGQMGIYWKLLVEKD